MSDKKTEPVYPNKLIRQMILDGDLTITAVIDEVIQLNGFIGVGLITLGDQLKEYCYNHKGYKKETEDA